MDVILPERPQEGGPAETVALEQRQLVGFHPAQGEDLAVDDAFSPGFNQFFFRKVMGVALLGNAVEDRAEEKVVTMAFVFDDFFQAMA